MSEREILFRGKRKDNGQWVYGGIECQNEIPFIHTKQGKYYVGVPVVADTVCQYTGLTDAKGIKIFEGDIIDTVYDTGYVGVPKERLGKSVVLFHNGCFMKKKKNNGFFHFIASDIETVIGNIFDDEHLLAQQIKFDIGEIV